MKPLLALAALVFAANAQGPVIELDCEPVYECECDEDGLCVMRFVGLHCTFIDVCEIDPDDPQCDPIANR